MKLIADSPSSEMYRSGLEIDCACARCGSSCCWVDCWNGCEDGYLNRFEEDPLWFDDEYDQPCDACQVCGGWNVCCSGEEWCEANPLPGREEIKRGQIEWFTTE